MTALRAMFLADLQSSLLDDIVLGVKLQHVC